MSEGVMKVRTVVWKGKRYASVSDICAWISQCAEADKPHRELLLSISLDLALMKQCKLTPAK